MIFSISSAESSIPFGIFPELYRQARDLGLHHLLLSGWNKDGFDYGFPHYTPNPLLGTEEDLREAIQQVRGMGGHVAFYINSPPVQHRFCR